GALLDLGAGFHPDLTGRENTYVSGVISGLLRREIDERFDSIVAFAELEDFIDNPLRTYSTGMQMRLAFAIAAHIDPDVLLIDEVLAVGDLAFQRKCLDRIAQFRADGCTILLVSHDANQVQRLCDEVLWLQQGKIVALGEPEVVVGQYVANMADETRRRTPVAAPTLHTPSGAELQINKNRFGSLEMEITAVHLLDGQGTPVSEIKSGQSLQVEITCSAPAPIKSPIVGVTISREDGFVCIDTHTEAEGK
ncbi:MAG: Wzt carbohydrate-binding domain-containing protein, partial [Anaerolineae bacterium]